MKRGEISLKSIVLYRNGTFFQEMEVAITETELYTGLLGKTTAGSGLFLMGATAIHTFQMKFAIDAIYLNLQGQVLGIDENLTPNRYGTTVTYTAHVVEFNSGTVRDNGIQVGEQWSWTLL